MSVSTSAPASQPDLDNEVAGCVPSNDALITRQQVLPEDSPFAPWRGFCADSFAAMGDISVDEYIDQVRGR